MSRGQSQLLLSPAEGRTNYHNPPAEGRVNYHYPWAEGKINYHSSPVEGRVNYIFSFVAHLFIDLRSFIYWLIYSCLHTLILFSFLLQTHILLCLKCACIYIGICVLHWYKWLAFTLSSFFIQKFLERILQCECFDLLHWIITGRNWCCQ